ncbi:glycosyltransferase, partial [bacterium]|nr:glycosyltransferase [bacterium]
VFLIAGGGVLEGDLVSAASALGLGDQVRFLGERGDVPLLLRRADIMVNSSAWEGLPITILEAMAAGIPTVATDVGGTAEVISDGDCGLVVPSKDPESLAAAILKLAENPELRERLSSRAREVYRRRYTAEQMTRETEALYDVCRQRSAHLVASGRVRILYMIGSLARGGAERQLTELVTRVDLERFEPVVCSLGQLGALAEPIERAGVRVVSLEKRPGVGFRALWRVVRLIHELRPAVLHSYLPPANWRGLVAGRATAVPLIVSSVRNVGYFHFGLVSSMRDRMLATLIDVVVANAEAVRDFVIDAHWVPRARTRIIYNGICIGRLNVSESDLRSRLGGAHDGGTVVVVASLTPKKDHETFLASARLVADALPDTRFVIVGDGELRNHLVSRTAELGLEDRVVFIGETAAVGLHLSEADVSVLTSLREGCSNVILESMALERPVVATDVGGNGELIDDGVTGFLVEVGDAEGMARKVVDLLTDQSLRQRMGKAGRERVLERFVAERMASDTIALYEEMLDARVPGLMDWTRTQKARYGSGPIATS